MATISTQLRKFKEPTKDELTRSFFSIPPENEAPEQSEKGKEKGEDDHDGAPKGQMDINAVLSMGQEGVEDSYNGRLYLIPPYLSFVSLDRKSVRFTIPLCTIRRVERLNTRTGVYALSLLVWHGMKIVRKMPLEPRSELMYATPDRTAHGATPDRGPVLRVLA